LVSEEKEDSFGHGTFMTSLIIEIGRRVDVYVAKVAKNTKKLNRRGTDIKITEVCHSPPHQIMFVVSWC